MPAICITRQHLQSTQLGPFDILLSILQLPLQHLAMIIQRRHICGRGFQVLDFVVGLLVLGLKVGVCWSVREGALGLGGCLHCWWWLNDMDFGFCMRMIDGCL